MGGVCFCSLYGLFCVLHHPTPTSKQSGGDALFTFDEVWDGLLPALQKNGYIAGYAGGEGAVKQWAQTSWNGKPTGTPFIATKKQALKILKEKADVLASTPTGSQNDTASGILMWANQCVEGEDKKTCGDSGGRNRKGGPCGYVSGSVYHEPNAPKVVLDENGRCKYHPKIEKNVKEIYKTMGEIFAATGK